MRAEPFWNDIGTPALTTLEEMRRYARDHLSRTLSLDEIAVGTSRQLMELVYSRLNQAVAAPVAG